MVGECTPRSGRWIDYDSRSSFKELRNIFRPWMQIFTELRELISSGAIVFIPYFALPSFHRNHRTNQIFSKLKSRIKVPWDPRYVRPDEGLGFADFQTAEEIVEAGTISIEDFERLPSPPPDYSEALTRWMDAQAIGAGALFHDRDVWEWTSQIQYVEHAHSQHRLT